MERFKRMHDGNGFQFVFDRIVGEGETVIVKMPPISANKRGVNDIGWQTDGNAVIYATLSDDYENGIWTEIPDFCDINKTVTALKIVNPSNACRVTIRVILN